MSGLPDIKTQFAEWYQEIIYAAELADQSPVRGSFVIRPYGWAIWELIRDRLDSRIKETGHFNAAFPLLIPESFLKREAEHIEGFAPELAVVTHAGGKELEEPLVVRPTSETIIHYMFAQWIKSWRDLPLKINQWANVVRWEMRPRAFLRTTEFFWQEGHTAHETLEEANQEVLMMLNEYIDLAENYLAIPVIRGQKTAQEKFPGAITTMTFEGVMQDGKALQMGTSHLLSQSFAKAFEMTFQDREGNLAHPYLTSWGATTRLIGAVIMVHGDAKGLRLPPMIAPIQVVIIPIIKKDDRDAVMAAVRSCMAELKNAGIRAFVDEDETKSPGAKFYKWEMKGVPLRLELGSRDLARNVAMVADRVSGSKQEVSLVSLDHTIKEMLVKVQHELFAQAQASQKTLVHEEETKLADFSAALAENNGVYKVGWCGNPDCEALLKQHQASIRCIVAGNTKTVCFSCDHTSAHDVMVAKSY